MKLFLAFLILFFSSVLQANCNCKFKGSNNISHQLTVEDQTKCKLEIYNHVQELFNQNQIKGCSNEKTSLKYIWSCNQNEKQDYPINCKELQTMKEAKDTLESIRLATNFTLNTSINPDFQLKNNHTCKTKENKKKILGFNVKNKNKLKEFLSTLIYGKGKFYSAEAIFDNVENNSLTFSLVNDFTGHKDTQEPLTSDDVIRTHGLTITYLKNIADSSYNVEIEYQTDLYTNFTDPNNPDFRTDDIGNIHVSQYFVEENILKAAILKAKSGDSFTTKLGIGIHELNPNDTGRSLLFSSLNQQYKLHELVNEHGKPGSKRVYNNKVSGRDRELSVFLEGAIEKRSTFYDESLVRIFADTSLETRITGIHDASFLKGKAELASDIKISNKYQLRVGAGAEYTKYKGGDKKSGKYIYMLVGDKTFTFELKYERPGDKDANYLNPLPLGMDQRSELHTKEEGIWYMIFRKNY